MEKLEAEECFRVVQERHGQYSLVSPSPVMDLLGVVEAGDDAKAARATVMRSLYWSPLHPFPLTLDSGEATSICWSAKGRSVAVGHATGGISIFDAEQGRLRSLEGGSHAVVALHWCQMDSPAAAGAGAVGERLVEPLERQLAQILPVPVPPATVAQAAGTGLVHAAAGGDLSAPSAGADEAESSEGIMSGEYTGSFDLLLSADAAGQLRVFAGDLLLLDLDLRAVAARHLGASPALRVLTMAVDAEEEVLHVVASTAAPPEPSPDAMEEETKERGASASGAPELVLLRVPCAPMLRERRLLWRLSFLHRCALEACDAALNALRVAHRSVEAGLKPLGAKLGLLSKGLQDYGLLAQPAGGAAGAGGPGGPFPPPNGASSAPNGASAAPNGASAAHDGRPSPSKEQFAAESIRSAFHSCCTCGDGGPYGPAVASFFGQSWAPAPAARTAKLSAAELSKASLVLSESLAPALRRLLLASDAIDGTCAAAGRALPMDRLPLEGAARRSAAAVALGEAAQAQVAELSYRMGLLFHWMQKMVKRHGADGGLRDEESHVPLERLRGVARVLGAPAHASVDDCVAQGVGKMAAQVQHIVGSSAALVLSPTATALPPAAAGADAGGADAASRVKAACLRALEGGADGLEAEPLCLLLAETRKALSAALSPLPLSFSAAAAAAAAARRLRVPCPRGLPSLPSALCDAAVRRVADSGAIFAPADGAACDAAALRRAFGGDCAARRVSFDFSAAEEVLGARGSGAPAGGAAEAPPAASGAGAAPEGAEEERWCALLSMPERLFPEARGGARGRRQRVVVACVGGSGLAAEAWAERSGEELRSKSSFLPFAESKWYYVDPKGKVQGPFPVDAMREWTALRYFKPHLLLTYIAEGEDPPQSPADPRFAPLGDASVLSDPPRRRAAEPEAFAGGLYDVVWVLSLSAEPLAAGLEVPSGFAVRSVRFYGAEPWRQKRNEERLAVLLEGAGGDVQLAMVPLAELDFQPVEQEAWVAGGALQLRTEQTADGVPTVAAPQGMPPPSQLLLRGGRSMEMDEEAERSERVLRRALPSVRLRHPAPPAAAGAAVEVPKGFAFADEAALFPSGTRGLVVVKGSRSLLLDVEDDEEDEEDEEEEDEMDGEEGEEDEDL